MDLKLNGRVVVITGPAKGMGAAITRAFASEGGKLALLGRDAAAIEPVAEEARAMAAEAIVIACDVTSGAACDAAIAETKARFGGLIGSSKLAYDTAYPLLVGFSSIPKVAVVPILVLWYGAGTVPAILTAMIICIFPIVVNVATGIATVEPGLDDVMETLKASKLDILWNVSLPRSMPYFFAALKVAITLAFVGSVVAETVASNRGIGHMMMIASSSFNVPLVFAGLFVLAGLGVSLYVLFSLIEHRLTGWAHRKTDLAAS